MFHKRYAIEYRVRNTSHGAWKSWPSNLEGRWYLATNRDRVMLALRIMHFAAYEFRPSDPSIMADVEADFVRAAKRRDPTGYTDTAGKVVGGRLARG